jgi:hypothetical protein
MGTGVEVENHKVGLEPLEFLHEGDLLLEPGMGRIGEPVVPAMRRRFS